MVRTKDSDGVKSNLIVSEVQRRPCLFDTNHPHYGDRGEKSRSWEEVCKTVVPCWAALTQENKLTAGKEVQKRWRSIRDSYTKAYRQGKCLPAEQCAVGSRRYTYQRQMAFLLRALQNKKPRLSQDKYESVSELSSSPQHQPEESTPKVKHEPLATKTRPERRETPKETVPEPTKQDKTQQTGESPTVEKQMPGEMKSLELKIDANAILPEDHFDDDKLFMNSLLPLFKKMDDDSRLLCRIEVLKIIRFALQGHKCFEALRMAEDSFFKARLSGVLAKEEVERTGRVSESTLSMTTRSADGSRPVRKRKVRSASPQPMPPKKRGPGRPRKVRPPTSDSEEEIGYRRRQRPPLPSPRLADLDEEWSKATSVAQLKTPLFMKMYNLERSKNASALPPIAHALEVSVKTEPLEHTEQQFA